MMLRFNSVITLTLLCLTGYAQRTDVFGRWKTIDDASGKPKSIVEIYNYKGKAYGKVIKLFREPGEDADPSCDKCSKSDPRYMKKVIGMDVITAMQSDNGVWHGGEIMDPENGQRYDGKIWLEGGKLQVRGYVAFFYRTQEWLPVE